MSLCDDLVALGIPRKCVTNNASAEAGKCRFTIQRSVGSSANPDVVMRVQVDGCWFGDKTRKVDYLFWCESASGRRLVLLVELKGGHFGKALSQIAVTLGLLCRRSAGPILHTGQMPPTLRHARPEEGGVQAHVVLTNGREVPQYQKAREELRKQYGIVVYTHKMKTVIRGVDRLPPG